MSRMRPIIQLTATECGLCCVAMVLQHHGSKESIVSIRQDIEAGRDGVTLRDVRQALTSRGFEVKTYQATRQGLKGVKLPVVAVWKNAHFVVIESVTDRGVTILDPGAGRVRLTPDEFDEAFEGIIVTPTPGPEFDPKAAREPSPWVPILRHLTAARGRMALVALASFLVYGVSVAMPWVTQKVVDGFVADGAAAFDLVTVGLVAVAAATFFGMAQGQVLTLTRLTVLLGRRLMTSTFGHLLKVPYKYFMTRGTGELIYRVNSVGMLRDILAGQVVGGVLDVGLIVVLLGYMLTKSVMLALVAFGFAALALAALLVTRPLVTNAINAEMTEFSKSQGLQIEAVSSIASLRVAGQEDAFYSSWSQTYERGLDRMRRRSIVQGTVTSFVTVLQTAAPVVILIIGLQLVGQGRLSLGEAVAFQAVTATFFGLVSSVYGAFTQFIMASQYLERLSDLTRTPAEEWPEDGYAGPLDGGVVVEGLSFRFTSQGSDVLSDMSFEAPAGAKVAVVGKSGSGKTTLGQILAGLYRPTAGEVRYDGIPLGELDRTAFYQQVGVVPQEIDLQNKSIADNITMGHDLDLERLVRAARAAQIHDEIIAMPMGYDTPVSELGASISGGQRQRIALARAIYKNPRILILDEATSSLDVLNETRIADHLQVMRCTRIVIAHRLSTVVDADLILVVSDGQIVQRGRHDELIGTDGHYRELFRAQRDAAGYLGPDAATTRGDRADAVTA